MAPPDCASYAVALDRVRKLIGDPRASQDLNEYLTKFGGARFDQLTDCESPGEFTREDFLAVRRLNVGVLRTAQAALRTEALPEVQHLLTAIPCDLDIWEVQAERYDDFLGPQSPAWRLWETVFELQKGARSSGRGVTAGKLLHRKRPRLLPIFDRKKIGVTLGVDQHQCWEAFWCIMRDPRVRSRLSDLRSSNDLAASRSLLRVLDVVIWMSGEAA